METAVQLRSQVIEKLVLVLMTQEMADLRALVSYCLKLKLKKTFLNLSKRKNEAKST